MTFDRQCRCIHPNHEGGRCKSMARMHDFCGPCQSEGAIRMETNNQINWEALRWDVQVAINGPVRTSSSDETVQRALAVFRRYLPPEPVNTAAVWSHDPHCCMVRGCHQVCSHLCGTDLAVKCCQQIEPTKEANVHRCLDCGATRNVFGLPFWGRSSRVWHESGRNIHDDACRSDPTTCMHHVPPSDKPQPDLTIEQQATSAIGFDPAASEPLTAEERIVREIEEADLLFSGCGCRGEHCPCAEARGQLREIVRRGIATLEEGYTWLRERSGR